MSDEQTEQERDAAVIAEMREKLAEVDRLHDEYDSRFATKIKRDWLINGYDFTHAALRTIDRLTAERDAARAEVERLRAACEPIASSLEANLGYATGKPYFWDGPEGREIVQHTLRNAANNLRAALESEVDHD